MILGKGARARVWFWGTEPLTAPIDLSDYLVKLDLSQMRQPPPAPPAQPYKLGGSIPVTTDEEGRPRCPWCGSSTTEHAPGVWRCP